MVIKKSSTKKKSIKRKSSKKKTPKKKYPTLDLKKDSDIAMDFATHVYQKFNEIIKSVILFGSVAKKSSVSSSDIDIMIIIDDAAIKWDQELIAWYRTELGKILDTHPYNRNLHINTIKLSSWWEDLLRGDPVVINILRYGEAMLDFAGFFQPLKKLLIEGKIKPTPEAISISLQRAPTHIARSKAAELGAIEGLYWSMVDSAHAALIASNSLPPSPEHIPAELNKVFVSSKKLKSKYVQWYMDLLKLHKKIVHQEIKELKGVEIDLWQDRAEEFFQIMTKLVLEIVNNK